MSSTLTDALGTVSARIVRGWTYEQALAWQMKTWQQVVQNPASTAAILIAEHTPVITLGRSGDGSGLRVSRSDLRRRGIAYSKTARGGDLTYHGPGQWTIYPILHLGALGKDLHHYMRLLEEVTLVWLKRHQVVGERVDGRTGVWVRKKSDVRSIQRDRMDKIAAVGIAVRRWVSFHGTAVNIQSDLTPQRNLIIPCGITADQGGVTSLAEITGQAFDMYQIAQEWLSSFAEVFCCEYTCNHG